MKQYLNLINNKKYEQLEEPAKIIKNGGIVVFPTETVYGIGTNGLDTKAIEKIYEIKQRPHEKPISLLVNSIEMIEKIAKEITKEERALIEAFCPGPLTIILKKKNIVPNILTANGDTVGVRIPENEIALKLIEYANCPIATPSANISGKPSGVELEDIKNEFKDKVDFYIDGGKSQLGLASTIVQIIKGVPHILRHGAITKEQIDTVIAENYKK